MDWRLSALWPQLEQREARKEEAEEAEKDDERSADDQDESSVCLAVASNYELASQVETETGSFQLRGGQFFVDK